MRVLSSLLLAAAMLVAVPALADTPTTEQALAAAREAAIEAKSRYCMLEVARRTQEFDPEQALKDYRAAAEMPLEEHVTGGWALDSDCQVAEGLMELGDAESAAQLVRAGIDDMGEVKAARTDDVGGAYIMQVKALCRAAEILHAPDRAKANAALEQAHAVITKYADHGWYHVKQEALGDYLRALALKDPEGAYEQAKASTDSRRPRVSIRLVLNMLEADRASVIARLDEIMEPGLLVFRHPYSPGLIVSRLAATIFPGDPRQALDLAVKHKLDEVPDIKALPPLGPLVEAVQEVGPEGLPRDEKYTALYIRLTRDLARADYEMAMELALSLKEPKQRAEAVSEVCDALADTDLPHALEAAAKLIELWETVGKCPDSALVRAALALAAYDDETVPQLLRRLRQGWSITAPMTEWWRHRREAAATWLPELPDWLEFFGTLAVLENCADTLSREEGRALAEQALALPLRGLDERTALWFARVMAPFAPDLARESWQALAALDVAEADAKVITWRLDTLVAVAEVFEQQERGTSGAEVAEIRGSLEAAPGDAKWPHLYRARLAGIYAYFDGPLAKATAQQVIASLDQAPEGVGTGEVLSEAAVALSRVDTAAAKRLLLERQELLGNIRLFQKTAAGIARWRPELAAGMLAETTAQYGDYGYPGGVFGLLARDASIETVLTFLETRLDLAPREFPTGPGAPEMIVLRQHVARRAVAAVLPSERPTLGAAVLECLVGRQEEEVVGAAIQEAATALVLLSDEVLQALPAKLQALVAKLEFIGPGAAGYGLRTAIAAVAERDWQGSQELLATLPPQGRVQVLLMIPRMTRYRQSLPEAFHSR